MSAPTATVHAMTVTEWLLDSDPAIRWQVMRDLLDAPPEQVAAERARVATEGWGAALLALQDEDGTWDGGVYRPGWAREDRPFFDAWTGAHFTLHALATLGADPSTPPVARAIGRVREHVRWWPDGPRFFDGETEPCVNGLALVTTALLGQDAATLLARLLDDQLDDGGWNCDAEEGSTVSSFHSTICVLEGLLAAEQAGQGTVRSIEARHRGEEYLLERALLRRRRDGTIIDPRFAMLSYPGYWFYDVLRALDHLRLGRPTGDDRCAEAIGLLRSKVDAEGRWHQELRHEGPTLLRLDVREGEASRWHTLRALRVLRWWDARDTVGASPGEAGGPA